MYLEKQLHKKYRIEIPAKSSPIITVSSGDIFSRADKKKLLLGLPNTLAVFSAADSNNDTKCPGPKFVPDDVCRYFPLCIAIKGTVGLSVKRW